MTRPVFYGLIFATKAFIAVALPRAGCNGLAVGYVTGNTTSPDFPTANAHDNPEA